MNELCDFNDTNNNANDHSNEEEEPRASTSTYIPQKKRKIEHLNDCKLISIIIVLLAHSKLFLRSTTFLNRVQKISSTY